MCRKYKIAARKFWKQLVCRHLRFLKKKNIAIHPNLTDSQKLKIAIRALRCYANIDLWHWGQGIPKIDNEPYGGKNGEDTHKYNAFGIVPDQDGWEIAQATLNEIGER